jgi:hypothetical protein
VHPNGSATLWYIDSVSARRADGAPEVVNIPPGADVWEVVKSTRANFTWQFIVPEKARESIFSKIGMKGATIDSDFMARLKEVKIPPRLKVSAEELEDIAKRVRLVSVSWTWLRDRLKQIESDLDAHNRGDQTLQRLLRGLRTQIERHEKTGIPKPSDCSN